VTSPSQLSERRVKVLEVRRVGVGGRSKVGSAPGAAGSTCWLGTRRRRRVVTKDVAAGVRCGPVHAEGPLTSTLVAWSSRVSPRLQRSMRISIFVIGGRRPTFGPDLKAV